MAPCYSAVTHRLYGSVRNYSSQRRQAEPSTRAQIRSRHCGAMCRDHCCAYAIAVALVVAIITAAVIPIVPAMFIPAPVTAAILTITITFLITRNILVVVPVVLHKQDPLTAGVVLSTVSTPVSRVAWGHVQVDRRTANRYPLYDNRLTVDKLRRRIVTDVDTTIEAGFADA